MDCSDFTRHSLGSEAVDSLQSILRRYFPLRSGVIEGGRILTTGDLLGLNGCRRATIRVLLRIVDGRGCSSLSSSSNVLSARTTRLERLTMSTVDRVDRSVSNVGSSRIFLFSYKPYRGYGGAYASPEANASVACGYYGS